MSEQPHATDATQANPFSALGLTHEKLAQLADANFDAPTAVQLALVPAIVGGQDALVRARSGEGKTNAYILPLVDRTEPSDALEALVLLPTRGIAIRTLRNFRRYTDTTGVHAALEGGDRPDEPSDDRAAQILLATPARAARLLDEGDPPLTSIKRIVVDEVDAMLEMGAGDDLRTLLEQFKDQAQIVLIAGVITERVQELADTFQNEPTRIEPPPATPLAQRIHHACYHVTEDDPFDALVSFCKQKKPRLALVYAEDAEQVESLLDRLARVRVDARGLGTSGRRRQRRERGRTESAVIVVCEPATRQFSTMPLSHILHYARPADLDAYLARIDPCDRLHRRGTSVLFVDSPDDPLIGQISEYAGHPVDMLEPLPKPQRRSRGGRSHDGLRDRNASGRSGTSAREGSASSNPGENAGHDDQSDHDAATGGEQGDTSSPAQTPRKPKTLGGRFRPRSRSRRFWPR